MSREKLVKMLDEDFWMKVRVRTVRRLVKNQIKGSTFDSIINDLIDCNEFYSDRWDEKK